MPTESQRLPHLRDDLPKTDEARDISREAIESRLSVAAKLHVYDRVTSTNDIAGSLNPTDMPEIVIADTQTKGRGRLGRSFFSPPGTGLYLSACVKPDFELNKSLFVTMAAAVAVCRAIEEVSEKKPAIKWVNDIFVDHRKVCGILTETGTDILSGKVDKLIIGIGINCFAGSFPKEISRIAGALTDNPSDFSRSDLAGAVINNLLSILETFTDGRFLAEYRRRCFIRGREIRVHLTGSEKGVPARALDIDEDGGLVVEYVEGPRRGHTETLHSGEISIRPKA